MARISNMSRLPLHTHGDDLVGAQRKSLISAVTIHDNDLALACNRQRSGRIRPQDPFFQNHLIAGFNVSRQLLRRALVSKRLERSQHDHIDALDQKTGDQEADETIQ